MPSFLELFHLAHKRTVPVGLIQDPGHPIDSSLFNPQKFQELVQDGLKVSPLEIILSAMIHYKGRWPKSPTMRLVSSISEIIGSVRNPGSNKELLFNDQETNEWQTRSTEAIAVGLANILASQLFEIPTSYINVIEGSKKRCDFEFVKSLKRYVFESKGRKRSISDAVKDTYEKKSHYSNAFKYGFFSKVPRNHRPTEINILDPDFVPEEISRDILIAKILQHYASVAIGAGWWRMSEELEKRARLIIRSGNSEQFNNQNLDFGNVVKLGQAYQLNSTDESFSFFLPTGGAPGFSGKSWQCDPPIPAETDPPIPGKVIQGFPAK
ncbi:MAG: hypothetical protein H6581_30460 [Bacteroidia bacterium]|nr:hypothetical protein [Bacteroidia bacterium]